MEKKKLLIIIGSVVAAIVVILLICLCVSKKSNEKELNNKLVKLGRLYYEDFYYPQQEMYQENVADFLALFKDTGLSINVESIARYDGIDKDLINSLVNKKTKKKCDFEKSIIIIYPQKPYGKKDYKIEVELECGFKKKSA